VWTDGQAGEDIDYFADHFDGVSVTLTDFAGTLGQASSGTRKLEMSASEKLLFKACLGDSDFDTSNNVDVYNWDYGTKYYPHIVKLVRSVTTYTDGGYYAVTYFDGTDFILINPFVSDDGLDAVKENQYDVYTTKGTLALTSNRSEATFGYGSKYIYMSNVSYDTTPTASLAPFDGDISCEVGNNNAYKTKYLFHCLNKTDMFTLLNWEAPYRNPRHINMYTAERLYTMPYERDTEKRFNVPTALEGNEMHFMTHVITTDLSTNWGAVTETSLASNTGSEANDFFRVYKFFPATASQYEYVAPCSNRGLCDTSSGTCKCFSGYTSDSCHEQISVSC